MQEKMEVAVKTQETFSQNQDSNRGITKFGKNGGKHGEEDGYWMQGGLGDLKITSSEIKGDTAKSEAEQVSLELLDHWKRL